MNVSSIKSVFSFHLSTSFNRPVFCALACRVRVIFQRTVSSKVPCTDLQGGSNGHIHQVPMDTECKWDTFLSFI